MSIKPGMPSDHLILWSPLLLSFFPTMKVFSNGLKYWSFSFNISPFNEHSGLISLRIDWFDLAIQGTLKSLLQHRISKALILKQSAFFMVQLSHSYKPDVYMYIYVDIHINYCINHRFDYTDICWQRNVSAF